VTETPWILVVDTSRHPEPQPLILERDACRSSPRGRVDAIQKAIDRARPDRPGRDEPRMNATRSAACSRTIS